MVKCICKKFYVLLYYVILGRFFLIRKIVKFDKVNF